MEIRIWLTRTCRWQFILRRTGLFIAAGRLRVTSMEWPRPSERPERPVVI